MTWLIRIATPEDASSLPEVEFSASRSFLAIPALALLPDGDEMPIETHQRYIAQGTEWVAVKESRELVGFLAAEIVNRDLHIWELAVRREVQNRGIGRQLIEAAEVFARERHLESMTLTTFSDVPWNAPWYSRLGFEISNGDERLAALVRIEIERGLPQRCAMRRIVDGSQR
jgi:GNAT superfamily N-acetyltransferase